MRLRKVKNEKRDFEKAFIFAVLFATLAYVSIGTVSAAATHYVNPDESIQDAVDAANTGDTIIVRDGTYGGIINVYKRLTIQSENGAASTIILGLPFGNGFEVNTNYVTISGFTIEDASFSCGILLSGVNNCNISNNIVSGNLQGIFLSKSSRNIIFNNNAFSNENCGIVLDDGSTHNQIIKNDASNNVNYHGIILLSSSENIIVNNTAENNGENGIYLEDSDNNQITDNDASNSVNYNGIALNSSNNNEIRNNSANSNYYDGIGLWSSNENTIANNTAKNNGYNGIYLEESYNNIVTENNAISNDGNGISMFSLSGNTITSNTASNNNQGGIYLEDSDDNQITDNDASNNVNYSGIELNTSNNNEIRNNIANSNYYDGIVLWTSSENIIANNTAENNRDNGIYFEESNNNIVTENNANNNDWNGISMFSLSGNTITSNTASNNNQSGIWIEGSTSNIIRENNACNNNWNGISIYNSSSNTLRNNLLYDNRYNFGIEGYSYSDFDNDIDTSNTVDGKLIYYWIGRQDEQIPDDAGVVGIVNSINITVRDLTLTNNLQGVLFAYTINSKIENVTTLNNWDGIRLLHSSNNNTLTNNHASDNDGDGIWLWNSSNYNMLTRNTASNNNYSGIRIEESNSNKIYLNNFINNTDNVYSENSANIWNSTEKISYTYRSKQYTNYLGNYWSNYTGSDGSNDGIGDAPYVILNDNNDNYPLMQQWKYYFASTSSVFDTGAGTYPSIQGTHEGKIKPSCDIEVSELYTYSCAGTAGHTESIKIYDENGVLKASCTWNGYQDDWHNMTITPSVTLKEGREYRYVIETGSYPQIIHVHEYQDATGGFITCDKFTDVNGKIYTDWIPAIKLWS